MKLKAGDQVAITTGKDKGKSGKIQKVFTKTNKVLVEGINEFKRHVKARTQNEKSEIKTIYKPVPVSNVMFVCPKCKEKARIGYTFEGTDKMRVCKKCEQTV